MSPKTFLTSFLIVFGGLLWSVDAQDKRHVDTVLDKPHQAHINLIANKCLFVVEGTSAVLHTRHLNATTTFENQDPVLMYNMVTSPRCGWLELQVKYNLKNESTWQWEPISRQQKANSFTQSDIDNNLVRYVHNSSVELVRSRDIFHFRLQSAILTGPAGNFCIQVLTKETLQQLVNVGNISVLEGGSTVIREVVHNSSLPIFFNKEIDIEQLEITYVLEQFPVYGEFRTDGRPLIDNSFTLSDIRNGLLVYIHSGSENHADSFTFFAEFRSSLNWRTRSPYRTILMEAHIMITPVNDHEPVLKARQVSVPEGGWVRITPAMINIEDHDLPRNTINIFLRQSRRNQPEPWTSTGHFAFYDHKIVPIKSFTMQNISDGQVVFVHHLNGSATLSYMQYLRVDDGDHIILSSIAVVAIPLTVLASPVNLPSNSQCFAELDATAATLSVPLNHRSINISVNDFNGNDPNYVNNIIVTVATTPDFGEIVQSPNNTAVVSFQGGELLRDAIFYHFSNRTAITSMDTFNLEFRYGHGTSGLIPFTVCINHIPLPILNHTRDIYLARGNFAVITMTDLLATHTRAELSISLYYNVTEGPRHGILFNRSFDDSNLALENFTQEDVNKGFIAYHHRDNMTVEMRDSFQFKVCTLSAPAGNKGSTQYACTETYTFTFVLHVVNLTVINTGFEVNETSSFIITKSQLNAIAPQGFYVEFHIPENGGPKNGQLNLAEPFPHKNIHHFQLRQLVNGKVFYEHTRQETLHDSFKFTAIAVSNEEFNRLEVSGVVNIKIIPANNWPPEFVNRKVLHVVKLSFAVISSNILEATDSDSDMRDEDLVYEMPPHFPFYGYIYYREAPSVKIYRWTEGDLRQNRVFYKHTGSISDVRLDLIGFYITDGKHRQFSFLSVAIKDIILENVAPNGGRFTVTQGMQAVITKNYLQYNATNDNTLSDEDYTYNIVTNPLNGTLLFNNSAATTFTQQDLETGQLVYTHNNNDTHKDSFQFTITIPIREATSEIYTFPIKILPGDDEPPLARQISHFYSPRLG